MAGVILNGSTSGSVTLDPPAVAGSTVITLPSTSGTMALSGGAVSGTTGTFTDFVGTSATGALKLPVGTTAERPATPSSGQFRINSTTGVVELYLNSTWQSVGFSERSLVIADSSMSIAGDLSDPAFTLATKEYDALSELNTSNGRFTPKYSGYYMVSGHITWSGNNSMMNGGEVYPKINKNGTGVGDRFFTRTWSAGTYNERGVYKTFNRIVYLTPSDYVTISLQHRQGVTNTFNCRAEIFRVG